MIASTLWHDLTNLFYPQLCCGCDTPLVKNEPYLCLHCRSELPYTSFAQEHDNPMERIFTGRVDIAWASALLYFSKDTRVQHIIHHIKYKGRQDLATWMGKKVGADLVATEKTADLVVPVPLHPKKEKERGYNQSALLAGGIAEEMAVPMNTSGLVREQFTGTQTRKSRIARWENVGEAFRVTDKDLFSGKNILLVDDVVTTGATLEACVLQLQQAGCASVAIATLGFATHF